MSDDIMETVQLRIAAEQERLSQIEAEILSLRAARERAEAEVARLLQFADTYYEISGIQPPENLERVETETHTNRRPKNPSREAVAAASLDIIIASGRPQSRKELFDALHERGLVISGKDPEMVLSTMLWRSQDRIVRLPSFGYWPKTTAYSDAAYFPSGTGDIFDKAAKEPEDGVEADDAE
jgi:hypothetical protein